MFVSKELQLEFSAWHYIHFENHARARVYMAKVDAFLWVICTGYSEKNCPSQLTITSNFSATKCSDSQLAVKFWPIPKRKPQPNSSATQAPSHANTLERRSPLKQNHEFPTFLAL